MASAAAAVAGHDEQPQPNYESYHESAALTSSSSSALSRRSSHHGGDVPHSTRWRWAARLVKHAWAFLRSSAALLSSILAWLGIWELMDVHAWPRGHVRDVLYVVVSTVVMALVGTLLPNCGIYEDHTAQDAATRAALDNANEIESVMGLSSPSPEPQVPAAVIPSDDVVVGVGESDDHATLELAAPHRDSTAFDANGTSEPLVADSNRNGRSYAQACIFMLTRICTRKLIIGVYLRSLVSMFASIVFWTGSYNLLLELFLTITDGNALATYIITAILGWLLMWTTGTLSDQAGLTKKEQEEQQRDFGLPTRAGEEAPARSYCRLPPRVRVYIRAFFAILGCMLMWLGGGMLLELGSQDFYTVEETDPDSEDEPLYCTECMDSTPARNAIFTVVGILFFLLTNTMAVHAGVEESNRSAEHAGAASADGQSSQPRRRWISVLTAHPLFRHVRALIGLLCVMLVWTGIWDSAFTATTEASGAERMYIYTAAGLVGLMLTDSLFSNGGVVPPFSMARRAVHVQERLGHFLQEKEFRHAAQGGFAHDPALDHVVAQHAAESAANQEHRPIDTSHATPTRAYHSLSH